jgi:hypothetical protein
MAMLLWLAKPLLYLALFLACARLVAAHGPHRKAPTWQVVALATLGRLVLGVPGGLLAVAVAGEERSLYAFTAMVFTLGFALWLGAAKLAFPKAPLARLAAFAAFAEVLTATIDVLAFRELRSINFC